MRWALDLEQDMFVEAFSDWLDSVASPAKVRGWLDSGDPSAFEAALASEGWLALGVPESAGGQGGGLLELALTAEQLARRATPSSAWTATVLALPALDEGTIESTLAEGSFAAIVANAERPLDDPAIIETSGDTLTGTVRLVLGADRARLLIVPAGDDLFLVDTSSASVTIGARELLDRSRSAADVTLDGVTATKLATDAASFLRSAALRAAVLIAADSLGAATRLRELAVEYSLQRTQFGVAIGSFQAMKHAAATMLVNEEASRSLAYYAAESVDNGLPEAFLHAAAAKAQVTRSGSKAAESSLTMHGAIGYTWEHDLQLLYKRAKLDVALFGDPHCWNERLAVGLDLIPVA